MKISFIRRAGRIIPIRAKQGISNAKAKGNVLRFKKPKRKIRSVKSNGASLIDVGFAFTGSLVLGTLSQKTRQQIALKTTGKKSLGNPLSNIATDAAIGGTAIGTAAKFSPAFKRGLKAILSAGKVKL